MHRWIVHITNSCRAEKLKEATRTGRKRNHQLPISRSSPRSLSALTLLIIGGILHAISKE